MGALSGGRGGHNAVRYFAGLRQTATTIREMKNSLRSNSFISLNITVRHKPETARTALYAARPPDKARQKVAPTTDSITLPPALRK